MTRAPNRRVHPQQANLEAFVTGQAGPDQAARIEKHLRQGCLPCLFVARERAIERTAATRETLRTSLFGGMDRDALTLYAACLDRKVLLIELEQILVPALVAELMLRPPAARREAVRKSHRYQLLALGEALREESRQEAFRDIARCVELAELAVEVADCLNADFYGRRLVDDGRALAYASLGNALRVSGDLFGAERQLRAATDLLSRGTGAPNEQAEVLSFLASLRLEQSRFPEAVRLLEEATRLYRTANLEQLEAKTLIKLAKAAAHSGNPTEAIDLLERSLRLLDQEADAELAFLAHHNIAHYLNDAGRSSEARSYLESIRPWYERFAENRGMQLRRRWLEGRIAASLGEVDEAVTALQEVRSVFAEEDYAFDNALVTLDLSAVYLTAGRTAEVKRLAEEMYPIFRSQDVHRQALAALVLYKQAALSEAATVELVRQVADYLNRSRNNPYMPFEPGAD